MQDEINQKVSQFMDDELSHYESLDLLTEIKKQPHLDEKLRRYELARAVLKKHQPVNIQADFSEKISQSVEQEVVYFLPKKRTKSKYYKSALAVAAGVAGVAVLVNNNVTKLSDVKQQPYVVASSIPQQTAKISNKQPEKIIYSKAKRIDPRINNYLQAHRGNLYTIDSGVQTYATLAGYGQ